MNRTDLFWALFLVPAAVAAACSIGLVITDNPTYGAAALLTGLVAACVGTVLIRAIRPARHRDASEEVAR